MLPKHYLTGFFPDQYAMGRGLFTTTVKISKNNTDASLKDVKWKYFFAQDSAISTATIKLIEFDTPSATVYFD